MPKKRTVRPFYGKREQRMEHHARTLMRGGHHDSARQMFDAAEAGQRLKLLRHLTMIARRPIARLMTMSRQTMRMINRYTDNG